MGDDTESASWTLGDFDPKKVKVLPRQIHPDRGTLNFKSNRGGTRTGDYRAASGNVGDVKNVNKKHEGVARRPTESKALNNLQTDQ